MVVVEGVERAVHEVCALEGLGVVHRSAITHVEEVGTRIAVLGSEEDSFLRLKESAQRQSTLRAESETRNNIVQEKRENLLHEIISMTTAPATSPPPPQLTSTTITTASAPMPISVAARKVQAVIRGYLGRCRRRRRALLTEECVGRGTLLVEENDCRQHLVKCASAMTNAAASKIQQAYRSAQQGSKVVTSTTTGNNALLQDLESDESVHRGNIEHDEDIRSDALLRSAHAFGNISAQKIQSQYKKKSKSAAVAVVDASGTTLLTQQLQQVIDDETKHRHVIVDDESSKANVIFKSAFALENQAAQKIQTQYRKTRDGVQQLRSSMDELEKEEGSKRLVIEGDESTTSGVIFQSVFALENQAAQKIQTQYKKSKQTTTTTTNTTTDPPVPVHQPVVPPTRPSSAGTTSFQILRSQRLLFAEESAYRTALEHEYAVFVLKYTAKVSTEDIELEGLGGDDTATPTPTMYMMNTKSNSTVHSTNHYNVEGEEMIVRRDLYEDEVTGRTELCIIAVCSREAVCREYILCRSRLERLSLEEDCELERFEKLQQRMAMRKEGGGGANHRGGVPPTAPSPTNFLPPRPPSRTTMTTPTTPDASIRRLRSTLQRKRQIEVEAAELSSARKERLSQVPYIVPMTHEDELTCRERLAKQIITEVEMHSGSTVTVYLLKLVMWTLYGSATFSFVSESSSSSSSLRVSIESFFKEWLATGRSPLSDDITQVHYAKATIMEHAPPHLQLVCAGMNFSLLDYGRILQYVHDAFLTVLALSSETSRCRQITNLFIKWDRMHHGSLQPQEVQLILSPMSGTVSAATRRLMECWWLEFEEKAPWPRGSAHVGIALPQFHALMDVFLRNTTTEDAITFRQRIFALRDALDTTLVDWASQQAQAKGKHYERQRKLQGHLLGMRKALEGSGGGGISVQSLLNCCTNENTSLQPDEEEILNYFLYPIVVILNMSGENPWTTFCDHVSVDAEGVYQDIVSFSWFSVTEPLYRELWAHITATITTSSSSSQRVEYSEGFVSALYRSEVVGPLVTWVHHVLCAADLEHGWSDDVNNNMTTLPPDEIARRRTHLYNRLARGVRVTAVNVVGREIAQSIRVGSAGSYGSITARFHQRSNSPSSYGSSLSKYSVVSTMDSVGPYSPPRSTSPWIPSTTVGCNNVIGGGGPMISSGVRSEDE